MEDSLATEEKDTLEESPASQQTSDVDGEGDSEEKPNIADELLTLNKSVEGLKNEKEKLEKELGELRRERRVRRALPSEESEEEKDEEQPTPEEPKGDMVLFKQAQRQKARKEFIKRHPEYGDLEADTMFNKLEDTYSRVRQNSDMDSDEILEDMETAWAVVHRDDILKKSRNLKRDRLGEEMEVADLASSSPSASSPTTQVKATPSDYRSAKIAGMPIDKYLKIKEQLDQSSFS